MRELGSLMRALGNNPTHAEVNQLMARADVDHNGRLDIREFIRMMHNYNTEMMDPEAEDIRRTREIMEAFRCGGNYTIPTASVQLPVTYSHGCVQGF